MSIFDPFSEDLREENETLKKRVKELEDLTVNFDTRGLARLHQSQDKLEKENEELKLALKRISSEKTYVESQSTGMKQWFKTQGAQIAEKALKRFK